MSIAFRAQVTSTQKLVLLALCDSANDAGECYPSVPTLTLKCSLSERAVQTAVSDLERLGQLRRELRTGRSTVYWMTPSAEPLGPRHYVYRIDFEGGGYYIGVRSCPGRVADDKYMGSGAALGGLVAIGKAVLGTYETRQAAEAAEFEAVSAHLCDPLCVNRKNPPNHRTSCTPQQMHPAANAPTPATGAPQPPQQAHPTPATGAPRTINEPSVETSGNRKETRVKKLKAEEVCTAELIDAGFDLKTAQEFIAHKQQRKAPLTARAWADHLREADKAGWAPMAAAEKVMARNWSGFEARYVAGQAAPASASQAFATKNAEARRLLGMKPKQAKEVIDA